MKRMMIGLLASLSSSVVIVVLMMNYNTPLPKQADIAIYAGRGTWDESVRALRKMFEWMNYTVETVSAHNALRTICAR